MAFERPWERGRPCGNTAGSRMAPGQGQMCCGPGDVLPVRCCVFSLQCVHGVCYSCPWSCHSTCVQRTQPRAELCAAPAAPGGAEPAAGSAFPSDPLTVPTLLVSPAFILQVWALCCSFRCHSSASVSGCRGQSPWVVFVWVCWECRLGVFGMGAPLRLMDRVLTAPDTFFTCQAETCIKSHKGSF